MKQIRYDKKKYKYSIRVEIQYPPNDKFIMNFFFVFLTDSLERIYKLPKRLRWLPQEKGEKY